MVGARQLGGVMTAIIMVFEMTRDYAIIVPVIVAVAARRRQCAAPLAPRDDLHRQAAPPRPPASREGAPRQSLPRPAGAGRSSGAARSILAKAGSTACARACRAGRTWTICAPSSSSRRGRIVGSDPAASRPLAQESANNPGRLGRRLRREARSRLPRRRPAEPRAGAPQAPPRGRRRSSSKARIGPAPPTSSA